MSAGVVKKTRAQLSKDRRERILADAEAQKQMLKEHMEEWVADKKTTELIRGIISALHRDISDADDNGKHEVEHVCHFDQSICYRDKSVYIVNAVDESLSDEFKTTFNANNNHKWPAFRLTITIKW